MIRPTYTSSVRGALVDRLRLRSIPLRPFWPRVWRRRRSYEPTLGQSIVSAVTQLAMLVPLNWLIRAEYGFLTFLHEPSFSRLLERASPLGS